jgi:hypothetical protein
LYYCGYQADVKIKIPMLLVRIVGRFEQWANIPVWRWVRRIDILVGFFGLLNLGWGWHLGGWWGALQYGLFYVFVCMCALWFF